ncbi:cytochrome c [Novosphingobium sp. BL-8A]|uniref:c-type cytochrome n=1 Tax=Novosphingobium sp. BL-8A TaxID=3127639 RepID=UPI0037583F0D
MTRKPSASKLVLAASIATLLAVSACKGPQTAPDSSASASDSAVDVGAIVKERKANFKDIGKSNKVAKAALESTPPDFATASSAAASIKEDAGKIVGFFPEGTGPDASSKTEALPVIWQKNGEFKAAAAKLASAADELKTAADAKDLAATAKAMGNIGGACKGCHEQFRKKDK